MSQSDIEVGTELVIGKAENSTYQHIQLQPTCSRLARTHRYHINMSVTTAVQVQVGVSEAFSEATK